MDQGPKYLENTCASSDHTTNKLVGNLSLVEWQGDLEESSVVTVTAVSSSSNPQCAELCVYKPRLQRIIFNLISP